MVEGDMVEKTKMINKDKNKPEESLINSLKHLWNLVNNLLEVNSNFKSLIDKLDSMEILSITIVYYSQQRIAL